MDCKDCRITAYDGGTSKLYLQSHGNVVLHYQNFSSVDVVSKTSGKPLFCIKNVCVFLVKSWKSVRAKTQNRGTILNGLLYIYETISNLLDIICILICNVNCLPPLTCTAVSVSRNFHIFSQMP